MLCRRIRLTIILQIRGFVMNFKNALIYSENFSFESGAFSVENGRFSSVMGEPAADAVDLDGALVIPGLIDIHSHGNSGHDFSDGDYEGLKKMAAYYAENGITSFAGTSLTLPYETLSAAFATGKKLFDEKPAACSRLRGIYVEGPFFSSSKKGAQNPAYLRLPDSGAFNKLNSDCGELIRIVCIAPELDGARDFIREVSACINVSLAHTDCSYDEARSAFEAGATELTHLFNAMPPLHHRNPGPIAAGAENSSVFAEIIGDGYHVHPAMIRLAFSLFGPERMILISDSLRCCGMPDGETDLGGQKAILSGGVARLLDGTIAGSSTNVYECMKRVVSFGIKKEDAIRAATYNPAVQLGCIEEVGSIVPGKQADFVIADSNLEIQSVYIAGEKI